MSGAGTGAQPFARAARADAPLCLAPRAPARAPKARLPAGTCDTHMHVFGPVETYPLFPVRNYTPQPFGLPAYLDVMARTGIDRAVLVQPSVYGIDNRAMLDVLAAEPERFRGVVVVPPDLADAELAELHALGVRGIRVNRRNPGGLRLEDVGPLAARIAPLHWHLQLQVDVARFDEVEAQIRGSVVPIVIDHFGFPKPEAGVAGPGFAALRRALAEGRTWLKLSAPYRVSGAGHPYGDLRPLLDALLETRPDRLLWATDWPHTELWDAMPDTIDLVDLAGAWFPDPAVRDLILVDNPDRLYWAVA